MLNIEEITNTIEELENSNTTFENCLKLASLYIVRDNFENANKAANINESAVVTEYHDILPKYHEYVDIKIKFQLGQASSQLVENSIRKVCKEIEEFISTMYSCTDMQFERDCIKQMILELNNL